MVVLFGGDGFSIGFNFLVSSFEYEGGAKASFSRSSPFFPNKLIVSFFASITLTIGG